MDLSAFTIRNSGVQAFRTSGSMADGEHWSPVDGITAKDSSVIAPLKANSITTLIVDCLLPGV